MRKTRHLRKYVSAPIAKGVGEKLLSHGNDLARVVADDILSGKTIQESIVTRGQSRVVSLGKEILRNILGHSHKRRCKNAPVKAY